MANKKKTKEPIVDTSSNTKPSEVQENSLVDQGSLLTELDPQISPSSLEVKENTIEVVKKDFGIYNRENYEMLKKLRKVVSPSKEQMEEIFRLFKLFVNPLQKTYQVSCNCQNSIVNLYWTLIKFFDDNRYKFEGSDEDY